MGWSPGKATVAPSQIGAGDSVSTREDPTHAKVGDQPSHGFQAAPITGAAGIPRDTLATPFVRRPGILVRLTLRPLHMMRPGVFAHSCALLMAVACSPATRTVGQVLPDSPAIDAIVIHPPLATSFTCSEHPLGAENHAGDALGADCLAYRSDGGASGTFDRFYTGDGSRNEDWFSWNQPLLAPFDGVVRGILRSQVTNRPGTRGPDPAAAILFERFGDPADAPVQVGYAHVQDIQVKVGDTVRAGQFVARIGNSGNAMFPHVHVGALRGDLVRVFNGEVPDRALVPLQVRFDLGAMGRLRGYIH
jgi:hypothetical protein